MAKKPTKQNKAGISVRLSMAMENYLLSIFRLQEEGNTVTVTQLAEHLKTLPEAEGLGTSWRDGKTHGTRRIREN